MLIESTVKEFNRVLGSSEPAPGGGSVAALSGALGAELVCMVCSLSIGKKGLEAHEALLKDVLEKAQKSAKSLLECVDLDTQAFNGVMAAFKLPKETDADKRARSEAIQQGYMEAVQSPLHIAMKCLEVLRFAKTIVGKFNQNAVSDLGVASLEAHAGLEGAAMNVRINLPSIKDKIFVSETNAEVAAFLEEGKRLTGEMYEYVQMQLNEV